MMDFEQVFTKAPIKMLIKGYKENIAFADDFIICWF